MYLERCLERRTRASWDEEGVARAQFRYSQVLDKIGEKEEAQKMYQIATDTRLKFMKKYPKYLPQTDGEEVVFDQMVSVWSGRFTGKMKQVQK